MNKNLFNIYHSFLYKKWHLIVYLMLLFTLIVGVMVALTVTQQTDEKFRLGLVDNDQTSETKLILKSIGDGQSIGNDLELKQMDYDEAKRLLEKNKLDGYFVFDKGMTDSFYKNGSLPISVHTFDKSSVRSVVIYQLTDSVYSRLMLSMGGAKSYKVLYPGSTKDEMVKMMTEMLFTGLNRNGSFDEQPVKLYDTSAYYTVSALFISIYLFYLSLFSILKMNQDEALIGRLKLLHFSIEKLTIARSIVTLCCTICFTAFIIFTAHHFMHFKFELYNLKTLLIVISLYLFLIIVLLIMIDCLFKGILNLLCKVVLTIVVILFSGATIPSVYFKDRAPLLYESPFSYIYNQLVELLLNNYLIEIPKFVFVSVSIVCILFVGSLVWRYRR